MKDANHPKTQSVPHFNVTTLAAAIASIKRNPNMISAPVAKLVEDIKVKPEQANAPMNRVETGMLVLGIFMMALKKKRPVQIIMTREDWDYIKVNKPRDVDRLSTIKEVFCPDPMAVNIEFRPLEND
jgi:translation elongation factor EF-1alpha